MAHEPEAPRMLVLDTSVAVKFYVREEMHEEALKVLITPLLSRSFIASLAVDSSSLLMKS